MKLHALKATTLSKIDSCEIWEILKNTLFYWTSRVAGFVSFMFPACNFVKKKIPAKMLFCEFCKIFKNIFLQNTSGWLVLKFICEFFCLSVKFICLFVKFSENLFYRVPLRNCLFHVQVEGFQQADTVKNNFARAFQAFYTWMRSSYSKEFIYLKSLEIICEEVN